MNSIPTLSFQYNSYDYKILEQNSKENSPWNEHKKSHSPYFHSYHVEKGGGGSPPPGREQPLTPRPILFFVTHSTLSSPLPTDTPKSPHFLRPLVSPQNTQRQPVIPVQNTSQKNNRTWKNYFRFEFKSYFSIRLKAEGLNFISRVGASAINGAIVGALSGAIFLPGVGIIPGFLFGLTMGVISSSSTLLKPFINSAIRYLKSSAINHYDEKLKTIAEETDLHKKAQDLSVLLSGCENSLFEYIYVNWLDKKSKQISEKNEQYKTMENILKISCSSSKSILENILTDFQNRALLKIDVLDKNHRYFQNTYSFSRNLKKTGLKFKNNMTKKIIDAKQGLSYNLTRSGSMITASLLPLNENYFTTDETASLYFIGFSFCNIFVSGVQNKFFIGLKNFFSHPITTITSFILGTALYILDVFTKIGGYLHDIHMFNPISFLFSFIIHYYKEKELAKKDRENKVLIDHFFNHPLKRSESEELEIIHEKLARLVRHYVAKDIPSNLKKLSNLIKKIESFKGEVATKKFNEYEKEFNSSLEKLNSCLEFIRIYEEKNGQVK